MGVNTKTKVMAIRMPYKLYEKVVDLAHQNNMNPSAYAVKSLASITRWKWEDTPVDLDSTTSSDSER